MKDDPDWYISGSKAFRSREERTQLGRNPAYQALKGYYVGLKTCLAGLTLVSDMNVTCFLAAGEMVNLMWQAGGFRDFTSFYGACRGSRELDRRVIMDITAIIKGCKIKTRHNGFWKKAKLLGPAASSRDSTFDYNDRSMTVQEYYGKFTE